MRLTLDVFCRSLNRTGSDEVFLSNSISAGARTHASTVTDALQIGVLLRQGSNSKSRIITRTSHDSITETVEDGYDADHEELASSFGSTVMAGTSNNDKQLSLVNPLDHGGGGPLKDYNDNVVGTAGRWVLASYSVGSTPDIVNIY